MEDLSLNNKSQSQNSFQVVTRKSYEEIAVNPEASLPHHVSDNIPENFEAFPMKRRYISARDLRAIS